MALPLILVLVLWAIWSGYWWWAQAKVKDEFSALRGLGDQRGIVLACSDESWGGYPFRITYDCTRPVFTTDKTKFSGGHYYLIAQVYNLSHAFARWTGPTNVQPNTGQGYIVGHDPAIASLHFYHHKLDRVSAQIDALRVSTAGHELISAQNITLHANQSLDKTDQLDIAGNLSLAEITPLPGLTLQFDDLIFDANISPVPKDVPPGLARLMRAAADANTTLTLNKFSAVSGKLKFNANGSIVFTDDGFPAATLTTGVNNLGVMLKRLRKWGLISRNQAQGSGLILGLFKLDDDTVKLNLIMKNGKVYWGPFKILTHDSLY